MSKIKNIGILFCFLCINGVLKSMNFTHDSTIKAMSWHPRKKILAVGLDQTVQVFDMIMRQEKQKLETDCYKIESIAWSSADEKMLAIAGGDGSLLGGKVEIFNVETGQHIQNRTTDNTVCSVAWHPRRRHLAVGLENGMIEIFDVKDWHKLHRFMFFGCIRSLAWHPNKNILAIKLLDNKKHCKSNCLVKKFDIDKKEPMDGFFYDDNPISVAWRLKGDLAIAGFSSQEHRKGIIYDILQLDPQDGSKHCTRNFDFLKNNRTCIKSTAYDPHKNFLAVALESGEIKIFKLKSNINHIYTIPSKGDKVQSIEWHPSVQQMVLAVVAANVITCYNFSDLQT